jgi:hypothetical protein
MKIFLLGIVAIAIVVPASIFYIESIEKDIVVVPEVDKYEIKIQTLKNKVLDDLSLGCETKGLKDPDGAIILDANNKMSIGRFMFQRETVQHYVKKFEGREITFREAIEISIDPVKSKALAERILFTEPDGWKNWLNCASKFNLANTIGIINELEK